MAHLFPRSLEEALEGGSLRPNSMPRGTARQEGWHATYPEGQMATISHLSFGAAVDVNRDAEAPTVVDADALATAGLDERWREFCLNTQRYAAEITRPVSRQRRDPAPHTPEVGHRPAKGLARSKKSRLPKDPR